MGPAVAGPHVRRIVEHEIALGAIYLLLGAGLLAVNRAARWVGARLLMVVGVARVLSAVTVFGLANWRGAVPEASVGKLGVAAVVLLWPAFSAAVMGIAEVWCSRILHARSATFVCRYLGRNIAVATVSAALARGGDSWVRWIHDCAAADADHGA